MNYPRALAPWAEYLNIFPRELSLALGTMVQRIALAIGSMRSRSLNHAGDIDGFDGIARRGSYEKLVASEWLLADEMPDEFARRAVMGEHLFLELARREPSAAQVSLAIFDAGPNQLGGPRIAHLAALIALARRAEAAGARFGWGIAQQVNKPIFPGVSTAEVMHLLEARDTREASEDDINAWRAKVADWQELDDLWLIGGTRLAKFEAHRGLSRVTVEDVFEPESHRLQLTVQGISNPPKSILLDLPEERACARLLRDPFAVATAAPQLVKKSVAPASNLVFAGNGAYLFARSTDGGIISYPVPNSPRAGVGRPKVNDSTKTRNLVAVGRFRKSIVLISAKENMVKAEYLHHGRHTAGFVAGNYESVHKKLHFAPFKDESSLQPCYRLPVKNRSESELFVMDGERSLYRLGQLTGYKNLSQGSVGSAWLLAREVLAVAPHPFEPQITYVGKEVAENQWRIVSIGERRQTFDLPFTGTPTNAFFGFTNFVHHHYCGLLAIERNHSDWWLVNSYGDESLTPLFDSRVVGITHNSENYRHSSLVVLENNQRTFALRNKTRHIEIHTASAPVEQVTVSHTNPYIAYTTVEGEVVVYSISGKEVLCRFLQEGQR
jgi:hypothetical protein